MSLSLVSPMHVPLDHQREVDDMVARVRAELAEGKRSLFKPAPPHAAPSTNVLDEHISQELHAVRRQIDLVGDAISNDPILLSRHAMSLQALDRVDQILGHLANVLARENKQAAIEQVSMGDLKARLQRRPLSN